jgi:hypothetical protein
MRVVLGNRKKMSLRGRRGEHVPHILRESQSFSEQRKNSHWEGQAFRNLEISHGPHTHRIATVVSYTSLLAREVAAWSAERWSTQTRLQQIWQRNWWCYGRDCETIVRVGDEDEVRRRLGVHHCGDVDRRYISGSREGGGGLRYAYDMSRKVGRWDGKKENMHIPEGLGRSRSATLKRTSVLLRMRSPSREMWSATKRSS